MLVTLRSALRSFMPVSLCLFLALPAFPQTGPRIGPSKGEVIGIITGIAAAIVVVGVVVYRSAHKQTSLTGCVNADQNGLSLTNSKDKKTYALVGNSADLKPGQQVTINGKKQKDSTGKLSFQVLRLTKNYGVCKP
jgi:hypothetical protein